MEVSKIHMKNSKRKYEEMGGKIRQLTTASSLCSMKKRRAVRWLHHFPFSTTHGLQNEALNAAVKFITLFLFYFIANKQGINELFNYTHSDNKSLLNWLAIPRVNLLLRDSRCPSTCSPKMGTLCP